MAASGASGTTTLVAQTEGYQLVFIGGAALWAIGAVAAATMIPQGRPPKA